MTNIVFDLGFVLIGWRPERAFTAHFDDAAQISDWMARVDFPRWNRLQDGGRSLEAALDQVRADHGEEDAAILASYIRNFDDTITEPVPGAWELLEELSAAGHPLYAITNWGADTWPAALARYPRLASVFRDIVVSGEVKLLKPEPEIYHLLLSRNGLEAGDSLFIDDTLANVEGARAVGMDAIHFTDAPALARELGARGLY
ncbi:HAD family hydrolase [Paracoccus aminophilus]|uniref:HAD family hydrolase n=1 Tax=Paracoccus aminophilus JCM 7686 TaxID=1367847 RepID=S5Y7C6_PARAH|nr:HAD family phosphatase [Paracoccus aminophilus]AGT07238.1 HAD family hydrolase [Paracoccus aminophilus JCM 7686]